MVRRHVRLSGGDVRLSGCDIGDACIVSLHGLIHNLLRDRALLPQRQVPLLGEARQLCIRLRLLQSRLSLLERRFRLRECGAGLQQLLVDLG